MVRLGLAVCLRSAGRNGVVFRPTYSRQIGSGGAPRPYAVNALVRGVRSEIVLQIGATADLMPQVDGWDVPSPLMGNGHWGRLPLTCTDALVTADNGALSELASQKRPGVGPSWSEGTGSAGIAVTEKTGQTAGVESHLCNEVSRYRVEHNVIPLWGQTTQCGTGVPFRHRRISWFPVGEFNCGDGGFETSPPIPPPSRPSIRGQVAHQLGEPTKRYRDMGLRTM